jgi:hypothetical protein
MSSNFLIGGGSVLGLDDGTANLNVNSLCSQNLSTNQPIKTDAQKCLVSSLLAISDTVGLQSALDLKTLLCFTEGGTPSTPASGQVCIYSKTDGSMYQIDDAGLETKLTGMSSDTSTWQFDTSTDTTTTPASGFYRTNNATPASATQMAIHVNNKAGDSMLPILQTLENGDLLYFCDTSNNCKLYSVTTTVNNTTWFQINLTFESENNVANYSLNDDITISYYIKNNPFDQSLNTTDSPSFVNLTSTGEFQNPENTLQYSTGIMSGGVLSINADDTKFDITAGEGLIVDPDTQTFTHVTWVQQLAQDFSGAGYTGTFTAVYVDAAGVLQASTSLINNEQRRNRIHVGTLSHPNAVNIVSISNRKYPILNTLNQLHDLQAIIGAVNVSGNVVSSNSLLTVAKASGTIYDTGVGFDSDIRNPNVGTLAATDTNVSDTFILMYQDNSVRSATATSIIPGEYDDGNGEATPGTVTSQNWSNMRVYVFNDNTMVITPGQVVYGTETDAQASIPTEDYTAPTNVATGLLIAFLTVRGGATDLSVLADAHILQATRFAGTGGGSAIQDFQGVYDNSSQPQITTSTALGALQVKRGSALDSDPVFEVLDGSDNVNLEIEGDGTIISTHTATEADQHTLEILHDAAGFSDTKALDIVYTTGASTGEEEAILINIDKSGSSSGNVNGLIVLATEGTATSDALLVGAGIAPLLHEVGSFADPSTGNIDNNGSTVAVGVLSGVNLFANDNDYVIVADSATFEEIEFLLGVVASGSGIAPTFEFSTGTGPLVWTAFSPVDGTNGLRNSGIMAWTAADVPAWITDGGVYKIKITRTRNTLATVPQANNNGIKVAAITEFGWDENADVTTNAMESATYTQGGVAAELPLLLGSGSCIAISTNSPASIDPTTSGCVIIGNSAGFALTTGDSNILIGDASGNSITTGSQNTSIGRNALSTNIGSSFNVAVGYDAMDTTTGQSNTAIGHSAGDTLTTGESCIFIGAGSDTSAATSSHQIAIGSAAIVDAANTMVIGNTSSGITTVKPGTTAVCDLGTASAEWKDGYFSGTVNCANLETTANNPDITMNDANNTIASVQADLIIKDSAAAQCARLGYSNGDVDITNSYTGGGEIKLRFDGVAGGDINLDGTLADGALIIPKMTNTEMEALTDTSGYIAYDTTNNKLNYNTGSAWVALDAGGGFSSPSVGVWSANDNTITTSVVNLGSTTSVNAAFLTPTEDYYGGDTSLSSSTVDGRICMDIDTTGDYFIEAHYTHIKIQATSTFWLTINKNASTLLGTAQVINATGGTEYYGNTVSGTFTLTAGDYVYPVFRCPSGAAPGLIDIGSYTFTVTRMS